MNIKFLGAHNTETETARLCCIQLNGRLYIDAGALTASLPIEAIAMPGAILLTHAHYDHIRDLPVAAMGAALSGRRLAVYGTAEVRETLATLLLNGNLYPRFLDTPEKTPVIEYTEIIPVQEHVICGHRVRAFPVKHSRPAVGYEITSGDGKSVFITGDTGPAVADCWAKIRPDMLVIEATMPDRYRTSALQHGHLCPSLLEETLLSFRERQGYLPQVVAMHINPFEEADIARELNRVSDSLAHPITVACEGLSIEL